MSSALAVPTLTITSVTGADGHQLPPGTTLSSIPSSSSSTLNSNNSSNNTSNNANNSNGNNTTSIGNGSNDNSSSNTTIKQERHDEAEIAEMAAKMLEQQRLALAKQVAQQQQIVNRQQMATAALSSSQHIPGLPGNQTNILNYLTRKTPNSQIQNGNIPFNISGTPTTPNISGLGNSQQNGATSSTSSSSVTAASNGSKSSTVSSTENSGNANSTNNSSASPDPDKKVCNDEESQKGHFGWATFGKIYIPYVTRSGEKYCAVRMVEMKLLNKYLSYLHPDIYSSCTYVRSYFITEAESRLLNEINHKHCDAQFGRDLFTLKDLVVRLSDATKFYQFLDICYRKLLSGSKSPSDRCGFIRINKESVVPYTVRNNEQVVPLFYFEGETDNLRQKADCLSGWDLAYLKFCCKVQGIRNELFSSESVAVISLKDIKSYFPNGTEFEDYWPSKVVDSNLLIASKNPGNSVNWTRQPSGPPPKITQPPVIPNLAKQQQAQNANNIANQLRNKAYQNAAALQNPNSVATQQRLNTAFAAQQSAAAAVQALTNGWGLNPALLSQVSQAQTAQLLAAQAQQQQNQRGYAAGRNQTMQNLLSSRQQYNYANGLQMTGMQHPQQQQPPPLVRSQSQSHMSLNPATANQLQAQQQQQQQRQQQQQQQTYNQLQMQVRQNAMAAANTVALQQQLLAQQQQQGANAAVNAMQQRANAAVNAMQQRASAAVNAMTTDPHNQMLRIIPEIPSNTQSPPYKVQKVLVFDNTMISCINMKAYNDTDQLMTLADFREHFFPNVQLDHCKRLIEALGVEMYKGNRRQIQTLIENGKPHSENIPLILVRDVIKYMPQLRYMMRSQEQPPQKRSRIS